MRFPPKGVTMPNTLSHTGWCRLLGCWWGSRSHLTFWRLDRFTSGCFQHTGIPRHCWEFHTVLRQNPRKRGKEVSTSMVSVGGAKIFLTRYDVNTYVFYFFYKAPHRFTTSLISRKIGAFPWARSAIRRGRKSPMDPLVNVKLRCVI